MIKKIHGPVKDAHHKGKEIELWMSPQLIKMNHNNTSIICICNTYIIYILVRRDSTLDPKQCMNI
jgi:hypothetical protein